LNGKGRGHIQLGFLVTLLEKEPLQTATQDVLVEAEGTVSSSRLQSQVQPAPDTVPQNRIGQVIADRYELVAFLGGGGMSRVYKAHHLHIKNKVFAVKLLSSQFIGDEQHLLRLQQEANAISTLSHPNIVTVHDIGLQADAEPYLVMDYLEGDSLQQLLQKQGPLDVSRLLNILSQTCSALAHAHEKGIIHRDIKPSNILISTDENGNDLVRLVDFGIAKITDPGEDSGRLTQTGDVLGSPLYMSPEQCMGHVVDGRTDIYALGCVIYECLTGKPPFSGNNVFQTIYKHINDAPPPFPVAFRAHKICRHLEPIVLKMLAKAPSERYQFVVEVASDLKRLEYQQSNFGDFKLAWDVWKARRSARARGSEFVNSSLMVASIVSLVVMAQLFLLPAEIQKHAESYARNQALQVELNSILEQMREPNSNILREFMSKKLHGRGNNLARDAIERKYQNCLYLAQNDQSLTDQILQLKEATHTALRGLKGTMLELLRDGMFGGDTMWNTLAKWTGALKIHNDLYARLLTQTADSKQAAQQSWRIFEASKVVGSGLLLVLPALLVLRFRQIRRGKDASSGKA